jgi:predicted small lipoprotein YifL
MKKGIRKTISLLVLAIFMFTTLVACGGGGTTTGGTAPPDTKDTGISQPSDDSNELTEKIILSFSHLFSMGSYAIYQ